jgi:hypothetical protein
MRVRFVASAHKHGVSPQDAEAAVSSAAVIIRPLDGEEDKWLVLGFDLAARLIELVGYELADGSLLVIHAMKCRQSYYRLIGGGDKK